MLVILSPSHLLMHLQTHLTLHTLLVMKVTSMKLLQFNTHDLTVRLKDDPNGGGLKTAVIPDNTFIRRRWVFL